MCMRNNRATALDPMLRSKDATEFANALHRKIVGQEQAVENVAEIYQMFMVGLNPPGRPVGNLLFLGPTIFRCRAFANSVATLLRSIGSSAVARLFLIHI